jgi:hypothetical protein
MRLRGPGALVDRGGAIAVAPRPETGFWQNRVDPRTLTASHQKIAPSGHAPPSDIALMAMSHSPPPALADFARRLVQHEADRVGNPHDLAAGLQSTCDALYVRLSPLISALGFQTLFSRAITLAAREFPRLATLTVTADGADCVLSGLAPADGQATDADADHACVAVLAHFLALLVLFIGEDLGLRTIRDVWPHVPFDRRPSSGVEP